MIEYIKNLCNHKQLAENVCKLYHLTKDMLINVRFQCGLPRGVVKTNE